MRRCFLALLALTFATQSQTASAAIEGYSYLNLTGFQLFENAGAGAAGDAITNGDQLSILSVTFSSRSTANIASIAGGPVTNDGVSDIIPNAGVGFGLNSASAYEGANPPLENTFSNIVGNLPHAHADTTGDGSIIAGIPGVSAPASSTLVSEVDLRTDVWITDSGRADSSTTSTATFQIQVNDVLNAVGFFTADLQLLAELIPFPPGIQASADVKFNISITDALGNEVFAWTPDGILDQNTITGGVEYSDPFDLTQAVSAVPGTTQFKPFGPSQFSAGFVLNPGIYTFNVESATSASATTRGVVPEPSTMFVWTSLCCSVGLVMASRKRRINK
jgi:hypothetical protein